MNPPKWCLFQFVLVSSMLSPLFLVYSLLRYLLVCAESSQQFFCTEPEESWYPTLFKDHFALGWMEIKATKNKLTPNNPYIIAIPSSKELWRCHRKWVKTYLILSPWFDKWSAPAPNFFLVSGILQPVIFGCCSSISGLMKPNRGYKLPEFFMTRLKPSWHPRLRLAALVDGPWTWHIRSYILWCWEINSMTPCRVSLGFCTSRHLFCLYCLVLAGV